MNLPQAFLDRMRERLGSDFPAFLASYDIPPYKGLRVNPLKISAAEFQKISPFPLGGQVKWEPNGFYHHEEKAGGDPYHFAGLYYLQEPSAMISATLAGTVKGKRVLDLCAAPGGKTTQLAAAMAGEGVLIANEIDGARAKILSQNIERMGVTNCAVVSATPSQLAARFPEYFDVILVDAPCSGEGMFKKELSAVTEWSEANVRRCAERQSKILGDASAMLKGGGVLVYSTCTFSEEEDEWQIKAFLKNNLELELVKEEKLYPHEEKGEGHYAAALLSHVGYLSDGKAKPYPIKRNSAAERAFRAFSEDFFENSPGGEITTLDDGRTYLVPAGMPALGVRTLRLGVELGEWDGKLFKPAHALVMAFGGGARRKVKLTREESLRYLRGETLEAELPNGWCAVCVEDFPLGLGKVVNGTVKNHLPKGLRRIANDN